MKYNKGRIEFASDNMRLERGFYWAKAKALSYVREGDPVGDWYEAALPGRDAFCMRDVAHQATGGQILGLDSHNKNMLRSFACAMSRERDFCSFWEINGQGQPVAVDYTNDRDFWYNLPANFDVLRCCWQTYLWTGDRDYIDSADFNAFYDGTVNDYIKAWDKNQDGIPERQEPGSRRGIPTYDEREGLDDVRMLSDLYAAQVTAFECYAYINRMKGNHGLAGVYLDKASAMRDEFDHNWWDDSGKRYYTALWNDGTYSYIDEGSGSDWPVFPLFLGLTGTKTTVTRQLELIQRELPNIEMHSYLPELFYRYGALERGYRSWLSLTDTSLYRREYPEASYAALEGLVTGMMGIRPRADRRSIRTLAGLPSDSAWMNLNCLPVFDGEIDVRHEGGSFSACTNRTGRDIMWQAAFRGKANQIFVDDKAVDAVQGQDLDGSSISWVYVNLKPGHQAKVILR